MTALLLTESDVKNLVSLRETVLCIEKCFQEIRDQREENHPRTRTKTSKSSLNVMHAALTYSGRAGVKIYFGGKFIFLLYDTNSSELLAVMGAKELGRLRTGAASAIATKYLTGLKSFKLGIAGTGNQALTQVGALTEVANLEKVFVWSPTSHHRHAFADEIRKRYGLEALSVDSLLDAFSKADVGTTITTAKEPFVSRAAAENLIHLNACGSNHADRSEIMVEALDLFPRIYVDDVRQARVEAGELIDGFRKGMFDWKNAIDLKDVVQGRVKKMANAHTLFRSLGIAAEDVAMASLIYDKAEVDRTLYRNFDFQ